MVQPSTSSVKRVNWPVAGGIALIHVGALAAFLPGFFSWSALAVMLSLCVATSAVGISLGFHRMLTHRGLRLVKPLEYLVAILGTLAFQGGPITWVATHRAHHAATDRQGDPHGPDRGFFWSHCAWLFVRSDAVPKGEARSRLVPDLNSQRFYRILDGGIA